MLLLELTGPNRQARIWFLDASGRRLADRVQDLPAAMRAHIRRVGGSWLGQTALDGVAVVVAAEGFGLLHWEARVELEAWFERPGAVAFAEADQRAMAFAAANAEMGELARIDPADHGSIATITGTRFREGRLWVADGGCSMTLPILPGTQHCQVRIELADIRSERDISVLLDGRLLARARVATHTHPAGSRMLVWLPAERLSTVGAELRLQVEPALGGPARAADQTEICRLASVIVLGGGTPPPGCVQAMAPSDCDLLMSFESLGDNCEFGFMQRHYGLEPIGLFRFAGAGSPRNLITMLESRLAGIGEPGSVGTVMFGDEFMVVDRRYGMNYHSFRYAGEALAEEVVRENEAKLAYLARKFLEDGEKILVYKRMLTQDQSEILAIHDALRRIGPARLLWVTAASDARPPGTVEWVAPGLLRGFASGIDIRNAHNFDAAGWFDLCRAAHAAFALRR